MKMTSKKIRKDVKRHLALKKFLDTYLKDVPIDLEAEKEVTKVFDSLKKED